MSQKQRTSYLPNKEIYIHPTKKIDEEKLKWKNDFQFQKACPSRTVMELESNNEVLFSARGKEV